MSKMIYKVRYRIQKTDLKFNKTIYKEIIICKNYKINNTIIYYKYKSNKH